MAFSCLKTTMCASTRKPSPMVGALFRLGAGWAAFVVDAERARLRAVKVARRNSLEAMIEGGLEPGDRVVVYPSDALKDGSRVEIRSPR